MNYKMNYLYTGQNKAAKVQREKPDIGFYTYTSHVGSYVDWDRFNDATGKYNDDIASAPSIEIIGDCSGLKIGEKIDESLYREDYICPACGGDGKETCNNPDHGFIEAMPGEIGRLGCPGCGHDPNHKVNRGKNTCPECGGYGYIIKDQFEEFGRETGYDEEPRSVIILLAGENNQDKLWQEAQDLLSRMKAEVDFSPKNIVDLFRSHYEIKKISHE